MILTQNLHKYYNPGKPDQVHALKGIDLRVDEGEFLGIVGKSGAGKSTLLHILGCIEHFESGKYHLDGMDISTLGDRAQSEIRNKKIGIVLQSFGLAEGYTVLQNAMIPLLFGERISARERKIQAMEVLEKVGLKELATCKVNKISGGQRQRTAIARALIRHPSLLLADEPTGALDKETSAEILNLFAKIRREENLTAVLVTHDPGSASFCDRVLTLENGRFV